MQNKQVVIIRTVGIAAKYGGVETVVEYLSKYLHDCHEFMICKWFHMFIELKM